MKSPFNLEPLLEIIGSARSWSRQTVAEFRDYLESDQFEADLDEFAARLGINDDLAPQSGDNHWKRVNAKALRIFKKCGERAAEGVAIGGFIIPRRFHRGAMLLGSGAGVLLVGYHCFQVFVARRKARA